MGGLLAGIVLAGALAYIAAERPFNFSLVDRECEAAQQQYYDARNEARRNKEKYPATQYDEAREQRNHANECAQYRMADAAERSYWLLVFSLLAALGAAIAAWLTMGIMKDTARRQMRAYLGICAGDIVLGQDQDTDGQAMRANVEIKNSGLTPAYKFRSWIEAIVAVRDADPFNLPSTMDDRAPFIVGTNTSTQLQKTIALTDDEVAGIREGTKKVFVWGKVEYVDAFDATRYFIFRCINGPATRSNLWPLAPHKRGYKGN